MSKSSGIIKSILDSFKPRDTYPPIKPEASSVGNDETKKPEFKIGSKAMLPEVSQWEDRRKDDTLYAAKAAILVGFPMSKPKPRPDSMHLIYKRGNGDFQIRISADAEFGMPFGQDQIILLALLDDALRNGNPKVDIGSIYRVLKDLGMSDGGKKYKLMQQSLLRIFGSSVSYWYKDKEGVTGKKCDYFKEIHLEILKDKYDFIPENGNYIIFSDELFTELQKHKIPYDIEMIKRLKDTPGAVRLYLWAAPRAFRIKTSHTFIPYTDLANDMGANITVPREFKRKLKGWIAKIDCELKIVSNKDFLIEIQDTGILLKKQEMVPGSHRRSSFKDSVTKKAISKKQKRPDINWDLEKDLEDFEVGKSTSLSQAAVLYKRARKSQ